LWWKRTEKAEDHSPWIANNIFSPWRRPRGLRTSKRRVYSPTYYRRTARAEVRSPWLGTEKAEGHSPWLANNIFSPWRRPRGLRTSKRRVYPPTYYRRTARAEEVRSPWLGTEKAEGHSPWLANNIFAPWRRRRGLRTSKGGVSPPLCWKRTEEAEVYSPWLSNKNFSR
jgi:hypothetical protein